MVGFDGSLGRLVTDSIPSARPHLGGSRGEARNSVPVFDGTPFIASGIRRYLYAVDARNEGGDSARLQIRPVTDRASEDCGRRGLALLLGRSSDSSTQQVIGLVRPGPQRLGRERDSKSIWAGRSTAVSR